jgi:hypothetical protein
VSNRSYYFTHSCEGFSAKVTIEWDIPKKVDETVIRNRIANAEDIADSIMGFAGRRVRDMVQVMRGYTVASDQRGTE